MQGDGQDDGSGEEARTAEATLAARLEALAIPYVRHAHPPLHTVEESRRLRGSLSGAQVKNMFLKDRRGAFWLVTCLEDRRVRLRDLGRAIGAKDPSFAKPEALWATLGVRPGAVTPFALFRDGAREVRFALDEGVLRFDAVCAHPMHNRATIALARADFERFLEAVGHPPQRVDFDALEAAAASAEAGAGS
ncbi:MAG: prolyl-tRNA synthetase associated domain-containing protein [Paracoccaceae bacterium]